MEAEDIAYERSFPHRFPNGKPVLLTDNGEPESFEEAKKDTHIRKWLSVIQEGMDFLHENHMYELTELLKGKRSLQNKRVYKLKPRESRNPPRYKARIVIKGFQQKKGVDFDKIFAPVVKMMSIRTMRSITASMDLEVEQPDIKMPSFMEIWTRRFTCNNRKDSWRKEKRTWYAN